MKNIFKNKNKIIFKIKRVVHYKDPVPHLPFKDTVGYVYRHEPTEVWYDTESGSGY